MIPASANQCGIQYTNAMTAAINAQTNRAVQMGVSITTIRIYNTSAYDGSQEVLQSLLENPTWDSGVLAYMASSTQGQQFTAQYYDAAGIDAIYKQIGQNIHIKLSGN